MVGSGDERPPLVEARALAEAAIREALEPVLLEGWAGEIAAQGQDRLPVSGLDGVVAEHLKPLELGDVLAPRRQRAGSLVDAPQHGLAGALARACRPGAEAA